MRLPTKIGSQKDWQVTVTLLLPLVNFVKSILISVSSLWCIICIAYAWALSMNLKSLLCFTIHLISHFHLNMKLKTIIACMYVLACHLSSSHIVYIIHFYRFQVSTLSNSSIRILCQMGIDGIVIDFFSWSFKFRKLIRKWIAKFNLKMRKLFFFLWKISNRFYRQDLYLRYFLSDANVWCIS